MTISAFLVTLKAAELMSLYPGKISSAWRCTIVSIGTKTLLLGWVNLGNTLEILIMPYFKISGCSISASLTASEKLRLFRCGNGCVASTAIGTITGRMFEKKYSSHFCFKLSSSSS